MAMTVHCDIVSAEGEIFSGLVEMVIAHGALGDLGIALGHAPLITNLKPGPIRLIKQGGEAEVFYISGGFLEVQPNMVKVLADTVQRAADWMKLKPRQLSRLPKLLCTRRAQISTTELRPHVWPRLQLSCAPSSRSARSLAVNPSATCCAIDKKG